MPDLTDTAWSVLSAAGTLPGGGRLVQSLTYLLDRRLGRQTPFDSHFHGPFSAEVSDALDRWVAAGLLRKTLTFDGSLGDPLEVDKTTLTPITGPGGRKLVSPAEEVAAAHELLRLAAGYGALTPVAATVAAKLAWIREIDPSSHNEALETLAASLNWSQLTDNQRVAGVALARALGW